MTEVRPHLNMSVGQTELHPAIRDSLSLPLDTPTYFREYRELQADTLSLLADVLGTKQEPVVLLGLGRTGLEAGMHNLLRKSDRVLYLATGTWGRFLGQIASNIGASADAFDVTEGHDLDMDRLQEALRATPYDAVALTHCETNTGALYDIAAVARCVREARPETLVFVDGISTFAGVPVKFDEWGLDCFVGGSQKCLNAPQGTPVVCYSARARERISNQAAEKTAYESFALSSRPSLILMRGLNAVLRAMMSEGLDSVYGRHRLAASAVREGIAAIGLSVFVDNAKVCSPTVTRIRFDDSLTQRIAQERSSDGIDGDCVTRTMMRLGVTIGEDRIGTMGHFARQRYVEQAVESLALTMVQLGYADKTNEGLSAVRDVYERS